MICLTALQARYTGFSPKNAEEFSSASRSVKPGLIAAGIVSAWTWAATLVRRGQINNGILGVDILQLQSCAVAYKYGSFLLYLSSTIPLNISHILRRHQWSLVVWR